MSTELARKITEAVLAAPTACQADEAVDELLPAPPDVLARVRALEALADAVRYAMQCGCLFPVPTPKAGASTEDLVRWGAMRNLHDKWATVSALDQPKGTSASREDQP